VDLHALGARLLDGIGLAVLHVQAYGIDLEEHPLAQSRTGEGQLGVADARFVVDLYARHLGACGGHRKAQQHKQSKNHTPPPVP
jgi:hypothetical protein